MNKLFYILLFLSLAISSPTSYGKKKQHYVVLPPGFENSKVVSVDTDEYRRLLEKNKELKDTIEKENKNFSNYKESVDDLLRKKDREYKDLIKQLEKERAKSNKLGFLANIFKFTTFLFPIGGVLLVILCVLNPAIIPVIINFFVSFIYGIISIITYLFKGMKSAADWIASFNKK